MIVRHAVTKLEDFIKLLLELDGKKVFILYHGYRTEAGVTCCPDCARAESTIEEYLSGLKDADVHFIEVDVGVRATWSRDELMALTCVHTLLRQDRSD